MKVPERKETPKNDPGRPWLKTPFIIAYGDGRKEGVQTWGGRPISDSGRGKEVEGRQNSTAWVQKKPFLGKVF